MAPPYALALCEILHQALKVYGHKKRLVLLTVVLSQLIEPANGLCPEVHPYTPDKYRGADPERQVGVELTDDRGHSWGRGSTQGLPTSSLDCKIEERIRGQKTSLRDGRTEAKRLVVEALCLPRNETARVIQRGRCCLGCGTRAVPLGWDSLLRRHSSHKRL